MIRAYPVGASCSNPLLQKHPLRTRDAKPPSSSTSSIADVTPSRTDRGTISRHWVVGHRQATPRRGTTNPGKTAPPARTWSSRTRTDFSPLEKIRAECFRGSINQTRTTSASKYSRTLRVISALVFVSPSTSTARSRTRSGIGSRRLSRPGRLSQETPRRSIAVVARLVSSLRPAEAFRGGSGSRQSHLVSFVAVDVSCAGEGVFGHDRAVIPGQDPPTRRGRIAPT